MTRQHFFPVLSALALALSVLACNQALPTTPTAVPVVTKTAVPVTPDNTPEWLTTVVRPLVNVRKSPNGVVVDALRTGAEVEIVQCSGNWCQIVDPPGWVFKGCLNLDSGLGCTAK